MTAFEFDDPVVHVTRTLEDSLRQAAFTAADNGLGVPDIAGKLLRPAVAWALMPRTQGRLPESKFAAGALAIQMAHEASLLHDDILDCAGRRRGVPSLQTSSGIGAALVAGDRYLTSAYVIAGETGSAVFVRAFAVALERTVAGEMKQGASRGRILTEEAYEAIIREKSGELFGAAAVLASEIGGVPVPVEIGVRIGSLYQRIDDLLDYCTQIEQDKPPLQDWRQRKWTFPLGLAGVSDWTMPEVDLLAVLRSGPEPPLMSAVREIEALAAAIVTDASRALADVGLLRAILDSWCASARRAVERELAPSVPAEYPPAIHRTS